MKRCIQCSTDISHKPSNKFCSQSCAAKFNNKGRKHTQASKDLISKKIKQNNLTMTKEQLELNIATRTESFKRNYVSYIMDTDFDLLEHQSKRKRIIIEQEAKCNHCGLSEWMGKPICFELDHIDGDNTNNKRENLEILCPNCHSNTPTWKGRKNAKDNSKILEYVEIRKRLVRAEGIEPSRLP